MSPLSHHLFWDTDPSQIDFEKHAAWLTRRVLEYGDWSDWQALVQFYGKDRLANIVVSTRSNPYWIFIKKNTIPPAFSWSFAA